MWMRNAARTRSTGWPPAKTWPMRSTPRCRSACLRMPHPGLIPSASRASSRHRPRSGNWPPSAVAVSPWRAPSRSSFCLRFRPQNPSRPRPSHRFTPHCAMKTPSRAIVSPPSPTPGRSHRAGNWPRKAVPHPKCAIRKLPPSICPMPSPTEYGSRVRALMQPSRARPPRRSMPGAPSTWFCRKLRLCMESLLSPDTVIQRAPKIAGKRIVRVFRIVSCGSCARLQCHPVLRRLRGRI